MSNYADTLALCVCSLLCIKGTQGDWSVSQRGPESQREIAPKEGVIRISEAIELMPQVKTTCILNHLIKLILYCIVLIYAWCKWQN